MKTPRRQNPEVNAGSMADIAFLLLIFFLVTAMIPNDKGINRKLPPACDECTILDYHQRNILEVRVNSNDELMVEHEIVSINNLKDIAKTFLDNNGDGTCTYCNGIQDKNSSDHPKKAIISLTNDNLTSYNFYIKVQDELTKAYYELRDNYSKTILQKPSDKLSKEDLIRVREAFPFILSESEIKN